jgi:hypothetical protein
MVLPAVPLTCPTDLTITPGAHPTKQSRSISGATRTRLFGSVPVGARLTAEFQCSSADGAATIRQFHDTFSGARPIVFPAAFFRGHEEVAAEMPKGLSWFYAAEPRVSPVMRGRVRVSVEFEGRLEV